MSYLYLPLYTGELNHDRLNTQVNEYTIKGHHSYPEKFA